MQNQNISRTFYFTHNRGPCHVCVSAKKSFLQDLCNIFILLQSWPNTKFAVIPLVKTAE